MKQFQKKKWATMRWCPTCKKEDEREWCGPQRREQNQAKDNQKGQSKKGRKQEHDFKKKGSECDPAHSSDALRRVGGIWSTSCGLFPNCDEMLSAARQGHFLTHSATDRDKRKST
jgi:hypothetical protein